MGRGIAQIAASSGHVVKLLDQKGTASDEAIQFIAGMMDRGVAKGRMGREEADAIVARLHPVASETGLAECGLVIEAVIERMEVKESLFSSCLLYTSDAADE